MTKRPYRFPARSRAAMIDAMESVGGYSGWNAPGRRAWPFAWNVKIHPSQGDTLAATLNPYHYDGGTFDSSFDSDFESHMTEDDSAFWSVIEDMRRDIVEGDWSDYDGNSGFEFEFAGRCGGHLVLMRGPDGSNLEGLDFDDMREDKEDWPFPDVRRLYRSIMVMEKDFSRSAVHEEWRFQLAFYRNQWEEGKKAERDAAEKALIAEAFRGEMGL